MTLGPDHLVRRLTSVDAVRGFAIAGVVIFHLVWDLDYAGLISPGFAGHPLWLSFGRSLAGTFMILVGVSLVLAHRPQVKWRSFLKRLAVIVVAAIVISLATFFAFPGSFIFFGILHAIAAASIVGVIFLRLPAIVTLLTGAAMIAAASFFNTLTFNPRYLAWIGFASQPPMSNDFVPVFPWVGLTLLGIALTKLGLFYSMDKVFAAHEPRGAIARVFAWFGRHSLLIYLIHQPILLLLILPFSQV